MNHFERILPNNTKRTNHVYLSSEDYVFPPNIFDANSSEHAIVINDDRQLSDVISSFRLASKLKNPGTGKKILQNVLRSTQINLAFIKIDFTKWVNENPIDVKDFGGSRYVVLREDGISDDNLCELLNIFSSTAPMSQPQLIILPNVSKSLIEHRLRYASSNITFSWLNQGHRANLTIRRAAPTTVDEVVSLFDRRCFEAVARVDAKKLFTWSGMALDIEDVAVRSALLRARILTAERAQVEPDVDQLLQDMNRITDTGIEKDTEPFLLMRSLVLLQKAYCSENPTYLNEALAIASTLGHELGIAMCLRYAHFFDVHPALESHMLNRAEKIFLQNDCIDLAIYCSNNRLASLFSVANDHSEGFEELLAQIDAVAPMIHRRGDIHYNLGVEHLLAGRLSRAYQIFQSLDECNARPLIVACARLGSITCERLENGYANIQSALELISYIQKNVSPSNRWHITNLLLNTLMLFRYQRSDFEIAFQSAKARIDLKDGLDVRDVIGENRLMATILGLDNYSGNVPMQGRFGQFFERTGMAVPYFFIWS